MELSNNKNPSYAIWHKKNGQKYLEVKASNHYQLGFIQGNYLFKKIFELKEIIHLIALKYIPKNFSYKKFKKMAKLYEKFIPKNFQLEMKGVADAIRGISYGDILLQNCFFDIFYGHLIPNDKHNPIFDSYEMGCTSFGALNQNNPLKLIPLVPNIL